MTSLQRLLRHVVMMVIGCLTEFFGISRGLGLAAANNSADSDGVAR